jgi:integral membrane sensor domain MASE1
MIAGLTPSSEVAMLLLGVVLGATPSATLGRILAAWLGKRVGVKPSEIAAYAEASDGDGEAPE